jgi:DNA-binding IclR family transcriptional regulator
MTDWTFLSSYGLVLVSVAKNPEKSARDIGDDVGLTERTTHKIIVELERAGYITRKKVGRKNTYRIHPDMPVRDTVTDSSIGELLASLGWKRRRRRAKANEG